MKRLMFFILALFLFSTAALADEQNPTLDELLEQRAALDMAIAQAEEDEIIEKAIESIVEYWTNGIYRESSSYDGNGYLEIKWTRVVYVDKSLLPDTQSAMELFGDMNCYVEFFLLSDYFGAAPYYEHAGIYECVSFKSDGTFEVLKSSPVRQYHARTYSSNTCPEFIDSIHDRGSDFNQAFTLLD